MMALQLWPVVCAFTGLLVNIGLTKQNVTSAVKLYKSLGLMFGICMDFDLVQLFDIYHYRNLL